MTPPVQWHVTSVRDIMIGSPIEGPKRGYRVTYETSNGVVSYIDVPHDEYRADKVAALINEQVSHHAAVLNLDTTAGDMGVPY